MPAWHSAAPPPASLNINIPHVLLVTSAAHQKLAAAATGRGWGGQSPAESALGQDGDVGAKLGGRLAQPAARGAGPGRRGRSGRRLGREEGQPATADTPFKSCLFVRFKAFVQASFVASSGFSVLFRVFSIGVFPSKDLGQGLRASEVHGGRDL